MRTDPVTVGAAEPLRRACELMIERRVSAVLVEPADGDESRGIVTSRDVLHAVADGGEAGAARVADHATAKPMLAAPDWELERAAEAMVAGGFRHLPVTESGRAVGLVSIRELVRLWSEERPPRVQIQDAMTHEIVAVRRDQTVREAARVMAERRAGSAVAPPVKPRRPPGIIAEREVVGAVATGAQLDSARVEEHLSRQMTFSAPDWSLRQAAQAMIKGEFLHVVVVDSRGIAGIISMRDILRRWLED